MNVNIKSDPWNGFKYRLNSNKYQRSKHDCDRWANGVPSTWRCTNWWHAQKSTDVTNYVHLSAKKRDRKQRELLLYLAYAAAVRAVIRINNNASSDCFFSSVISASAHIYRVLQKTRTKFCTWYLEPVAVESHSLHQNARQRLSIICIFIMKSYNTKFV